MVGEEGKEVDAGRDSVKEMGQWIWCLRRGKEKGQRGRYREPDGNLGLKNGRDQVKMVCVESVDDG